MDQNKLIAFELCTLIYNIAHPKGVFPALAGGTLYKPGKRKDIDIVLCNMTKDQAKQADCLMAVHTFVADIPGLSLVETCSGRVVKAMYRDVDIDFIYPEAPYDNTYQSGD